MSTQLLWYNTDRTRTKQCCSVHGVTKSRSSRMPPTKTQSITCHHISPNHTLHDTKHPSQRHNRLHHAQIHVVKRTWQCITRHGISHRINSLYDLSSIRRNITTPTINIIITSNVWLLRWIIWNQFCNITFTHQFRIYSQRREHHISAARHFCRRSDTNSVRVFCFHRRHFPPPSSAQSIQWRHA